MPDINYLLHLLSKFSWLGNWLFFILAFIESAPIIGVLIPGATLISIGGFIAYQGYLNVTDIIIFSALGAIVGDFFSYSLGRWGGQWIKDKKIINQRIIRQGEKFFQHYGNKSVFWGRFFGPIRAIIPFIAGLAKMKQKSFISWNILSGILWAILNVSLGYFSGNLIITILKKWSNKLNLVLGIIIILILFLWLIKKHQRSLISYFRFSSQRFLELLKSYHFFQKLTTRYSVINDFLKEKPTLIEKLFGSILILLSFTFVYSLIMVLDGLSYWFHF